MKPTSAVLPFLWALVTAESIPRGSKPPYLLLVGDSTVAVSGGWGDGLLSYVKDPAQGANLGKSGSTTVSWKSNGRWDDLLEDILDTKGDYEPIVTIQFGHNDQKGLTLDEYRSNLVDMATEIEEAGATPIFITPLTRRGFEDGEVVQGLRDWRDKMIAAAKSVGIKWLDLNMESTDYVNAIGEEDSQYYNLDSTDRTHLNEAGESVFGRLVLDLLLEERPDLEDYFDSNEALSEKIAAGEFATGDE